MYSAGLSLLTCVSILPNNVVCSEMGLISTFFYFFLVSIFSEEGGGCGPWPSWLRACTMGTTSWCKIYLPNTLVQFVRGHLRVHAHVAFGFGCPGSHISFFETKSNLLTVKHTSSNWLKHFPEHYSAKFLNYWPFYTSRPSFASDLKVQKNGGLMGQKNLNATSDFKKFGLIW